MRESLWFRLDVAGYPAEGFESAGDFLARWAVRSLAGLELLARLRAEGDGKPVPLITGSPSPAIAARAQALGVARVLEKPPSGGDPLAFVAGMLA